MILYPALDLRGGKVIRLQQGDPTRQTTYSDDPIATARKWLDMGAQWLHVVNIDGTLSTASDNERIVRELCKLGVPVQFGGGLRTAEDLARAIEMGVSRAILGTIAVQQPDLVGGWVKQYGAEKIGVALDAKDGFVATHGWQQQSEVTPVQLGKQFAGLGLRHALYTDVSRDGQLGGVNVSATAELARQTGLSVIASGGVGSLADVTALKATGIVAGVVLGKALYEGRLDLREALREAGEASP